MTSPSRLRALELIAIGAVIVGAAGLAIASSVTTVPVGAAFSTIAGLIGLLALYLLAANVLIEHRLDAIERQDVNHGSEILSQQDWYEHLCVAIKRATTSIDITHHEPRLPTMSGIPAKKEVFTLLYRRIRQKSVLVRMLIAVNTPDKLAWVEELVSRFGECPNLDIKHTDVNLAGPDPALSIQVVDGSRGFAIDMAKGHHTLSELDTDLYTREPAVVVQLSRYYASYWDHCRWIKEGGIIHHDSLASLATAVNGSFASDVAG